jgi:hypothetical protein
MESATVLPMSLAESARRLSAYTWIEQQLFAAVGGWVALVPEVNAKLMLGPHCYHHAWHAELFTGLLPTPVDVHPYAQVVPPNDAMVDAFAAMHQSAAPSQTIEKLVGLYRGVLPMMTATYRLHLARCSDVTDGPTRRVLELVLTDDDADVRDAEAILASLLSDTSSERRAAVHQANVVELFTTALSGLDL